MTRSIAKKLFLVLVISLVLPLAAYATPVYWDMGTDYNGNGSTTTDSFSSMSYYAQTSSYQFDDNGNGTLDVGETFTDVGNAQITSLLQEFGGAIADNNGFLFNFTDPSGNLYSGYEITLSWDDLNGHVTNTSLDSNTGIYYTDTKYDNGTIEMWVDNTFPYDSNFNGTLTTKDDTGFDNGIKVAEITVTSGYGYTNYDLSNGIDNVTVDNAGFSLLGTFTMLKNDFWFDALDKDISQSVAFNLGWFVSSTGGDTANDPRDPSFEIVPNTGGDTIDGKVYAFATNANHDASLSFATVPEPGTILLLGLGLLGLGIIGGKRKKS